MPPANSGEFPSGGGVAVIPPLADKSGPVVIPAEAGTTPDAAAYFREQLAAGAPWHRALLEAMGRWTVPEETWQGRRYKYIVGREAFDWLLLAEASLRRGR